MWLHVGLLYLSPFRATFAGMVLAHAEGPDEKAPDRALLHSKPELYRDHEAMALLHLDDGWQVQFYMLENTMAPIARFDPGVVGVTKLQAATSTIWPRGGGVPRAAARAVCNACAVNFVPAFCVRCCLY